MLKYVADAKGLKPILKTEEEELPMTMAPPGRAKVSIVSESVVCKA